MYNQYQQYINAHLFFSPFGDHGIGHTKRVLYLASQLANVYELTEHERKLLALACCYHDIGRIHDCTADEHGKDSADKLVRLKLDQLHNLEYKELEVVLNLITMHSIDDELFVGNDRETLMYQILKDADAIDRLRFDDLDEKYLRLPESKGLIQVEFEILKTGIRE